MLGTTLPTPLYGLLRARFGFSELMITVIFATYAAGVIVALVFAGRLSDQIGRRRVLLPGLGLSALSAACFLLAHGLPLLLAGRLLSGLSAGIFTGTATATLVDLAPEERRSQATLLGTVANMGGLGCGPLLAGALAQWAGAPLRLSFWVDLALVAVAAIGVWALPETVEASGRPQLTPQPLRVPGPVRAVFVRAALAGFAGFAVLGLFTAVSPAFLAGPLGVTSQLAIGAAVFAVFAASTLGQLALERVGELPALPVGCALLIGGMVLLGAGVAAGSLPLFLAGGLVAGVGQGLSFRAAVTGLNRSSPDDERASVASSFFVVAYVAISVPVIGEGLLAQGAGLKTAGVVFAGAVAALAAVVLMLLARRRD
jgi:MFS family permease